MRVACPMLGNSRFDGNGNKEKIMELFKETITDVDLTIFDYHQFSRDEMVKAMLDAENKVKLKDRDAYYKMVGQRKREANERFKKNGHRIY